MKEVGVSRQILRREKFRTHFSGIARSADRSSCLTQRPKSLCSNPQCLDPSSCDQFVECLLLRTSLCGRKTIEDLVWFVEQTAFGFEVFQSGTWRTKSLSRPPKSLKPNSIIQMAIWMTLDEVKTVANNFQPISQFSLGP